MKIIGIIGGLYGDEGKGLITSYYCEKYTNYKPLVIRFSGSAQAGHTVIYNGIKHIFSHFGSGTLQNIPTGLTKEFVCHPMLFRKERELLLQKKTIPEIYVDLNCEVTTPFDMMFNQHLEDSRGLFRHGSCGIGFGATIDRSFQHSLKVSDLFNKNTLINKLINIRDYYLEIANVIFSSDKIESLNDLSIDIFIEDCEYFIEKVGIFKNINKLISKIEKDVLIFEGSQGLLLDPNYGEFPHVTRKPIGAKEIYNILDQLEYKDYNVELNYLTRSYVTRHGNGPLPDENNVISQLYDIVDDTNIHNKYQGSLRFAPFNLDQFNFNIMRDFSTICRRIPTKLVKVMTCIDQIPKNLYPMDFINKEFDLISNGPTYNNVTIL